MDRLEVARFSSLPEAELAAGLLQRHGVDARVTDREMANNAAHLQIALGGIRVTAPDFQIVQARDLIARARTGEFGGLETDEGDEWMIDHTPGRVGELDEQEVQGRHGLDEAAGPPADHRIPSAVGCRLPVDEPLGCSLWPGPTAHAKLSP